MREQQRGRWYQRQCGARRQPQRRQWRLCRITVAAEDVMKVLDTDKNGKLDEAEFVAWVN